MRVAVTLLAVFVLLCVSSVTCSPQLHPRPVCGAVCAVRCLYGNILDSRGCPTCGCLPHPVYPPKCHGLYNCYKYCPYGYLRDYRGCPICVCRRPKRCPQVQCYLGCQYGYQTGHDGCPICKCRPYPHRG